MADDGGSKTEQPTSKKLKDARKKGDVPKSNDVGITLGFLFSMGVLYLLSGNIVDRIAHLFDIAMRTPGGSFTAELQALGSEAIDTALALSAAILLPLAAFGLLVEYLVIGPVLTTEKISPKMSAFNPAEGLKRMFGPDNLFELGKSMLKTALLFTVAWLTVKSVLGDIVLLMTSRPENIVDAMWYLAIRVFGYVLAAFLLFMLLDSMYQKYSFTRRMKMSMRDIRDELKQTEGNPLLKGARRSLGQEWAQEGATAAATDATVLVVNPVHVAIAIRYDRELTRVPLVTGKGEDKVALAMRQAAEKAGVPILRNEHLARTLLVDRDDDMVPRELFDIVAEVILWARSVSRTIEAQGVLDAEHAARTTPGEDLTYYDYAIR